MRTSISSALKYFAPSSLQVFYAFVFALLIALYWCRSQLSHVLIPKGSDESIDTFQEIIKQSVDRLTNNEIVGFLSVAFVWALVGVLILAIMYETINMFILIRNDMIIASKFTHAQENKKQLRQVFLVRLALGLGLVVCLIVAVTLLFPLWHQLINQPVEGFFQAMSIVKIITGILGLTATLCLSWRWILILLPKFV